MSPVRSKPSASNSEEAITFTGPENSSPPTPSVPPASVISGRAGGLFQSRPPALRYSAHALIQIGPPAVPGLIELFDIDPKRARLTVDPILMSIGRVTSHELPLLTRLLAHESAHVRKKAIIALQRIHPRAKAAIPSLLGILNDNDEEVRRFARSALDGMGPVSGLEVPVLIETLQGS